VACLISPTAFYSLSNRVVAYLFGQSIVTKCKQTAWHFSFRWRTENKQAFPSAL